MFKSVGIAIATDFILSVPLFIKNYRRADTFLSQDSQKLEVILNFWQTYEACSERLVDKTNDIESKIEADSPNTFNLKIGKTIIEFEASNLVQCKPQTKVLPIDQVKKPESSDKKDSKPLFSPRSPSLAGGEVVPISGSASFIGEAPPSSRSM